jgi:hypothetical protein
MIGSAILDTNELKSLTVQWLKKKLHINIFIITIVPTLTKLKPTQQEWTIVCNSHKVLNNDHDD